MTGVRTLLCGSDSGDAFGLMRHACLAALLTAVAIGSSGCGGGSGGSDGGGAPSGGTAGGTTPPPVTLPPGRGTVVVTVKDVLGAPVPGADVRINTHWVNEDKRAVADANGRAEFQDVIASEISVTVYGPESYEETPNKRLASDGVMTVEVIARPTANATGGIAAAWVPAGGVSDDGRTLEFSLQILQVPNADGEYWAWGTDAVRVVACTPDAADDLPRFRPDCVSSADGFDAAYEGVNDGRAVSVKRVENPSGGVFPGSTYAAALLLDQSSHVIVDDPADARLFAAKYFLTYANRNDPKLLAAFASDEPASGRLSLLPQKPVSLFPLENPRYSEYGRSYFPTVDDLGALEGGSTPLFAAIDRMLDFVAANEQRQTSAVVVVTNGHDDTCGSRADCQKIRDAVIQKSKATGVAIVTIGLADAAGNTDHETLGLLAQGAPHGAAFWAQNPQQLAPVLGNVHTFLGDFKDSLQATFRIQSPVAGTFSSGRKVLGSARLEVCPFDCFYTVVPFVVQIP
jgi:hypothetical protein